MDSVGVNCSQIDFNQTCFTFSEPSFWAVVVSRTFFSSIGAVLAFVAILYFVKRKLYEKVELKPAGRLLLYLCTASLFNGIITALQIVPVHSGLICGRPVVNNFCTTASTLIGYSFWTICILMFWINVEIIMAALVTSENKKYKESRCCKKYIQYRDSVYYDGCVIATTLSIPNIFCHIPIKLYGLAGAWCWIKTYDDECKEILAGVIEQFLLMYAWAMAFIVVFSVTAVAVWVIIYRRKKVASDAEQDQYDQYLKDARLFVYYPIIFSVIYGIGCINRVIYAFRKKTIWPLWIIHGISDALVSLLIPLLFLLYHQKKLNQLPRRDDVQEPNDPEREPLLPNAQVA